MTLMFTAKTITVGGAEGPAQNIDLDYLTSIFTTSTIIHSYLIGLVGGKISEESIAAGFKHSALLVILAVLAAKLVPMFINF